jgi:hypothetical protein
MARSQSDTLASHRYLVVRQGFKRLSGSLFFGYGGILRLQGLGALGGQTLQFRLWIPFLRGL